MNKRTCLANEDKRMDIQRATLHKKIYTKGSYNTYKRKQNTTATMVFNFDLGRNSAISVLSKFLKIWFFWTDFFF